MFADLPEEMVVFGKVVAPYGLRGAVKVHLFADDPLAWATLPQWWLGREGEDPSRWTAVKLLRCRWRENVLIAELASLADRDAAEAAKGVLVGAPRGALPPTGKDEYYWADLIGLDVVNEQGQCLGRVLGLIETPANAVLRIGGGDAQDAQPERLLPFVAAVVLEVDLPARRIRVDWQADW